MLKLLIFSSIVMNFMMAALVYQLLSQFKILEQKLLFIQKKNLEITNYLQIKQETTQVINQMSSYDDYIWWISIGLVVIGISLVAIGIVGSSGNSASSSPSMSDSGDIGITQLSISENTSVGTQTCLEEISSVDMVSTGVNASVEMISTDTQTIEPPFDVGKFIDTLSTTIKGLDKKLHKDFTTNTKTVTEQFDIILEKQTTNNDIINEAIYGILNSVIETMNKVATALTNISGQGEIAIVQKIAENPNTYEQIGAIIDATKDSV